MSISMTHAPLMAEVSQKGDGWHIYNSRGDRIAFICGEADEEVARAAVEAANAGPQTSPEGVLANTPVPWDRFAGAALSAFIAHPSTFMQDRSDLPRFATTVAEASASIADAMILERAKRWVGK